MKIPCPVGAGGHTKVWCVVDQVGQGTFEVVVSRDKLGVRKASKRAIHAASATDAALLALPPALYALDHGAPLSVTVKINVSEFVEIWKAGVNRTIRYYDRTNLELWEKFDHATASICQTFVEHVVPHQIEAAGLNMERTRTLDHEERLFGASETLAPSPQEGR